MNAIRKALIRVHRECPDFPVDRPKPSDVFWSLKVRSNQQVGPFHKRCGHCHAVKPFDAFHRDSHAPTGRQSMCRMCRSVYLKQGRAA